MDTAGSQTFLRSKYEHESAQRCLDIILNYSKRRGKHDNAIHPETMFKDGLKQVLSGETNENVIHPETMFKDDFSSKTNVFPTKEAKIKSQSFESMASNESEKITEFINKYIFLDNTSSNIITSSPHESVRLKAGGSFISKLFCNDSDCLPEEERPLNGRVTNRATSGLQGRSDDTTVEDQRSPATNMNRHYEKNTRIQMGNKEKYNRNNIDSLGEMLQIRQNFQSRNYEMKNPSEENPLHSESILSFLELASHLQKKTEDQLADGIANVTDKSVTKDRVGGSNDQDVTLGGNKSPILNLRGKYQTLRMESNLSSPLESNEEDTKHISFAAEPQSFQIDDNSNDIASTDEKEGTTVKKSKCKTKRRVNILEFDNIFKAELKRRHRGVNTMLNKSKLCPNAINNVHLEPTSVKAALIHSAVTGLSTDIPLDEDYELMNAIDKFIQADSACKFEEALRAAEIAANLAPPGYEEEAAAAAVRQFQSQCEQKEDLNSMPLDGKKKPIEIVAYVGSTANSKTVG